LPVRSRWPSVVGWGVFALTCLLVAAGGLLGANSAVARGRPEDAISALAFTATGALIIHRRRNPLGWLSLLVSLSALAYAGDSYAGWAIQHHGVGAGWADWLASWTWAPASLSVVTVMLLLVPTGRMPTTRWRPLLVAAWSTIALFTAVAALISQAPDALADPPVVVPALVGPAQHALPVVIGVVLVGNCIRAGQMACRYSWRMPPGRSVRSMRRD
jgi:two-component system NarL family sensor kinase